MLQKEEMLGDGQSQENPEAPRQASKAKRTKFVTSTEALHPRPTIGSDLSASSVEYLIDGLSANSSDLKVLMMSAEQVSNEQLLQSEQVNGSMTNLLIHATIDGESKQILSDSADS